MNDFSFGDTKDTVIAKFYTKAVQNNHKSENEGRAIFEDREFVEIIVPGNRGTVVDRPATAADKERWPRQYEAYKTGLEAAVDGTPIEEWSMISPALVEELKHVHVRTVEALAALSDADLAKTVPMGGQALRQKAKLWLEQAAGNAPLSRLQAQIDRLTADNERLTQTLREVAAQVPQKEAAE